MDLALQFPCVIADAISTRFEQSLLRSGDRRIWPQGKTTSSTMGRFKKGLVCCKKASDERSLKQEEIISLFRRIQSSISKERESLGGAEEMEKKESSDNGEPPLSKAILDVLEKPRKKIEDTGLKKEPKRRVKLAQPQSSFTKRYVRPSSASGSLGKVQDKALEEMTEKEEKPPLIETMKLAELKEVAKNRGIKGYSKLKKSDLLKLLGSP